MGIGGAAAYQQNVDSISQVAARRHVLWYHKDVITPRF